MVRDMTRSKETKEIMGIKKEEIFTNNNVADSGEYRGDQTC